MPAYPVKSRKHAILALLLNRVSIRHTAASKLAVFRLVLSFILLFLPSGCANDGVIDNPAKRRFLNSVPTSFSLTGEQVDKLIRAGHDLLRNNRFASVLS